MSLHLQRLGLAKASTRKYLNAALYVDDLLIPCQRLNQDFDCCNVVGMEWNLIDRDRRERNLRKVDVSFTVRCNSMMLYDR
mmetsp:Transcript_27666/g.32265  ORF Transcript_27666/g.32265 Transcript_27666/m.32265 type:complete len:81 (+) Transcript_27666:1591-1833(+)